MPSLSTHTYSGTGNCTCPDGGPYHGPRCAQCSAGHYGPECRPCACDDNVSVCDDGAGGTGDCVCTNGYQGVDCSLQTHAAFCVPRESSSTATPCLPGAQLLAKGYDVVAGAVTSGDVHAVGYTASRSESQLGHM